MEKFLKIAQWGKTEGVYWKCEKVGEWLRVG